jgi:HEAT repeat protein
MIEKGYPVPEDLNSEDKQVFEASMINTLIKERESGPDKVKAAITTLGRMKSENAVPYIMQIFPRDQYKTESIQALGTIGSRGALDLLKREYEKTEKVETQNIIILAMGRIGGDESLSYILDLFEKNSENALDPSTEIALLQALSFMAASGSYDKKIFSIFENYLSSPRPELRIVSVRGISHFKGARTGELLFGLLKNEDNEDVVLSIIQAVNEIGSASTIPTFSALLRGEEISEKVRIEILSALSTNPQGSQALAFIVNNFNSASEKVREATAACMYRLYQADPKSATGILARGLLSSKDEHYLKSGTAVLARIADPNSVNALYSLLQSPYPEVKKNVTWALYRVRAASNVRIAAELNKLVSSETEPLDVRINSVRALGAMGFDTPALKIWQTMITTAKMRGENYTTLRRFAIRALGNLGTVNEEVKQALVSIASREKNLELKKEALSSLQKLAVVDESVEHSLSVLAKQVEDVELKVRIIELLGDMGSPETVKPASEILEGDHSPALKNRVVYALSRAGGSDAYTVIIDAAADMDLREFILAVLESADKEHMKSIISRRLKAENDEAIVSLLEFLQEEFNTQF